MYFSFYVYVDNLLNALEYFFGKVWATECISELLWIIYVFWFDTEWKALHKLKLKSEALHQYIWLLINYTKSIELSC